MYKIFLVCFFSDRIFTTFVIGHLPFLRSDFFLDSDRIFPRNPIGFLPGSDRVIILYLSFRPDQVGWSDHPIILPDRVPESLTDEVSKKRILYYIVCTILICTSEWLTPWLARIILVADMARNDRKSWQETIGRDFLVANHKWRTGCGPNRFEPARLRCRESTACAFQSSCFHNTALQGTDKVCGLKLSNNPAESKINY